jgi:cytoskeletal protein CcmA (bactofilin family)
MVGKHVAFQGIINRCETLRVEGSVDASALNCGKIEIGVTGQFIGHAEVSEADVAGRYEGDLTVRGRLVVRKSGRVTGNISYASLEVDHGGQVVGDLRAIADRPH